MTEYKDAVEEQRLILQAEKWAKEIKSIHIHSLNSSGMMIDPKILRMVKWSRIRNIMITEL